MYVNTVYCMDSLEGMKMLPAESVNMVFTSPPYAEQRKNVYDGIPENQYVDWFLDYTNVISNILTPDGSFFLNIKEHTKDGFKSTYVLQLILAICEETKFNLVDTFAWTKQAYPKGVTNTFKNAWEAIYHFAKQPNIKIRPNNVKQPIKEETVKRAYRKQVGIAENGSGYAQPDLEYMKKTKFVYPSNHIHVPNIQNQFSKNKWHPAVFPAKLVEFFVKAYTDESDLVVDPFAGSATTGKVAISLGRRFIGFENSENYCNKIKETTGIDVIYKHQL